MYILNKFKVSDVNIALKNTNLPAINIDLIWMLYYRLPYINPSFDKPLLILSMKNPT